MAAGTIQNKRQIIKLLLRQEGLTKQEIAAALQISMPTVLHCIDTMMQEGLLEEGESRASTGGRKAKNICLKKDAGYVVGINIAIHHVECLLIDLRGNLRSRGVFSVEYADEPKWYQDLADGICEEIKKAGIDEARILGAGISIPGIVDEKAKLLLRSHILEMEHVSLDRFYKNIPYPLFIANDANCACASERNLDNPVYFYLSLNESVGGALMMNQQLYLGESSQAGEIGHMILHTDGNRCYCGKNGCADAYLASKTLLNQGQTLEAFFDSVKEGEEISCRRLETYLDNLAVLLTNLRMLLNTKLVVGGEVGRYLEPYLDTLCKKMIKYDKFARDIDYVLPCTCKESACAIGAAWLALERYLDKLL